MKSTAIYSLALILWSCGVGHAEQPTGPAVDTKIDFCRAFADKAAEAKLSRHQDELLEVKASIEKQLTVLDQKTKTLEAWVAKRDAIRAEVSASLVKIYTNVEPETASQQLQKLDVATASEVLRRLSPKLSGEIVSAMDVTFASKVVKIMLADAAKLATKTETP